MNMGAEIEDGPPMIHMVRAYRASGGRELPVLVDGAEVVRGSTAIVEYLESMLPEPVLMPADPEDAARVRVWVRWADDLLAPDARRLLVASWVRRPETSERYFFGSAPRREQLAFRPLRRPFGLAAAALRGAHPAAVRSSGGRVDLAFDQLDAVLARRAQLIGEKLTLADLSVAVAANMALVPAEGRRRHRDRPLVEWVQRILPAPFLRWE